VDEIAKEVTDILTVNGGSMVYKPLYEAVSFKAQRRLYPTLRNMKNAGIVTLVNLVNPDTHRTAFTISLV